MQFRTNVTRRDMALMQGRMFWQWKQGLLSLAFWTLLIAGFLAWSKGVPKTPQQSLTLLIASAGGGVGAIVFIWLMSMLQVYFGSNARSGVTGVHDFEIRDEGLFERTEANETLTKWASVKSVSRHGDFIYVEVGPALFHVIPRNSFGSEAEFLRCLKALQRRVRNDV